MADDWGLCKVNIHTHLIPFLLWTYNTSLTFLGSSIPPASAIALDTPILAFTVFSLFTLFSSVVWHTMAGCAHHRGMVLCAKIDYVGISWYVCTLSLILPNLISFIITSSHNRLISGSVGTIIYYGLQCNTTARNIFLAICLINGLAGTVIPFWDWFDKTENKACILTFSVGNTSLTTCVP